MIKLENERELAIKLGGLGGEDLGSAALGDILSNILDEPKEDECIKNDCQSHKHLFIKIDRDEQIMGVASAIMEKSILEEWWWKVGIEPYDTCSKKDAKEFIYKYCPEKCLEYLYGYHFYKCEICQKTYMSITIDNLMKNGGSIFGIYKKEPTKTEYSLVTNYQLIDFTGVLSEMRLVHEDPNDYELFTPPPKFRPSYDLKAEKRKLWEIQHGIFGKNVLQIEAEKIKLREQEQLEQRDKEQLVEDINFILKNCQTTKEKIESLNQLKREYVERLEQNENYKRIKKQNNEFMKWIS